MRLAVPAEPCIRATELEARKHQCPARLAHVRTALAVWRSGARRERCGVMGEVFLHVIRPGQEKQVRPARRPVCVRQRVRAWLLFAC